MSAVKFVENLIFVLKKLIHRTRGLPLLRQFYVLRCESQQESLVKITNKYHLFIPIQIEII